LVSFVLFFYSIYLLTHLLCNMNTPMYDWCESFSSASITVGRCPLQVRWCDVILYYIDECVCYVYLRCKRSSLMNDIKQYNPNMLIVLGPKNDAYNYGYNPQYGLTVKVPNSSKIVCMNVCLHEFYFFDKLIILNVIIIAFILVLWILTKMITNFFCVSFINLFIYLCFSQPPLCGCCWLNTAFTLGQVCVVWCGVVSWGLIAESWGLSGLLGPRMNNNKD
jgi:hypothetical protein